MKKSPEKLQIFNTDDGVYCDILFFYGINNVFEIFQRALEQNVGKIKVTKFFSDDLKF